MSGFAGFVNGRSAQPSRDAIEAMAEALAVRGPDAAGVWLGDRAALAHALFRTTFESSAEQQPLKALDRFVLVGDVRLDARAELVDQLNAAGQQARLTVPDIELIRHAWVAWRDDCVHHLLGDFSFVVWDEADRRLFGARDHFGVRPFYYATLPSALVFGNMLGSVRRHPDVPSELDDAAIVDVLAFRYFQDAASTAFRAIKRLPGGHVLTWQDGRTNVRRFWSGPRERAIRYSRRDEYVEHYRELFTRAVDDRLRTDSVAVAMTGGLDSSSVAAVAAELQRSRGMARGIAAHTIVYDRLIPDRERHFAGLVAQMAGIPIAFTAADDRVVYERHDDPGVQTPEPLHDPFRAMLTDFYREIACRNRVLLMGLDGDTLLCEVASDYLLAQLRRGKVGEYLSGVVAYMRTRHSLPPHRLRTTLRRLFGGSDGDDSDPPVWIEPAMRRRYDVDRRWLERSKAGRSLAPGWPLRPRATTVLLSPKWRAMFDRHDAEYLGARLEARFPFADIRLVEYLLNIPAVPWCIDKYVARQAMAGRLPDPVLARPKAVLAGDTAAARIGLGDRLPWTKTFHVHPCLDRYVDVPALVEICNRGWSDIDPSTDAQALMFNEWLWYHLPRS